MCRWAGRPARKLRRAVDGLTRVLAIELLTAARALDLRAPLEPAPATAAVRAGLAARGPAARARPLPGTGDRGGSAFVASGRRWRRPSPSPAHCAEVTPTCRPKGRRHGRRPSRPRTARHHPHRPVVADRGSAADAAEQPRPRGRRAARRSGRLRRHRTRGAQLGRVRRDGAHAHHAGRRRDDARPVRQAGRRDAHPRVGAARADRQLQPGRRLGDLAGVPPAGAARADHVRADDRRLVDLHRHPGHPAGHVRDLRRRGGQALRWHPGRHADRHRWLRRHGRRAAAGRHAQRRRLPGRRRRPDPAAATGPAPLSR